MLTYMRSLVLILVVHLVIASANVESDCHAEGGSSELSHCAASEGKRAAALLQIGSQISPPTKDHHDAHEAIAKKTHPMLHHKVSRERAADNASKTSIGKFKETPFRESSHKAPKQGTAGHRQEAAGTKQKRGKGVVHELAKQRKKNASVKDSMRTSLIAKQSTKPRPTPVSRAPAHVPASLVDFQSHVNSIVWKMIVPDPWVCDLVLDGDRRRNTCELDPGAETLDPKQLNCGELNTCAVEHANAFRTLYTVGSLPCCSTPPFCSAPVCKSVPQWFGGGVKQHASKAAAATCTKRTPEENVAFMKMPETWPAYHGFGGAFELDISKFFDLLTEEKPFDLAFDLGANFGYYTELISVRNMAKNYVLVEANPGTARSLRSRWGDNDWLTEWYTKQVQLKENVTMPAFEIITQALSNDTGMLDMCKTETSFYDTGCEVVINTIDNLVPKSLTPEFQKHFSAAKSAFVKVDTEGMDELVLRGMKSLLNQTRGHYKDGRPRYLVNFLQFEFSPQLLKDARLREGFHEYSIKTATKFMESIGFETFLVGPRYLPMSHGSWHEDYKLWPDNTRNNAGHLSNYPGFGRTLFHACYTQDCTGNVTVPSFTSDVFAIRASHPRAAEIKLALGACKESKDFDINDPQYATSI